MLVRTCLHPDSTALPIILVLGGEQLPVPFGNHNDGTIHHVDSGLIVSPDESVMLIWDRTICRRRCGESRRRTGR